MRALTSAVLVAMIGLTGLTITPAAGGSADLGSRGVVTLGTGCCKTVQ